MFGKRQLSVAAIGCGNRARVYLNLISEQPENFTIVAAADPVSQRVEAIRGISNNPNFLSFADADELLGCSRLADVLIIATQDNYHFDPCTRALRKGYDIVLEKPISNNIHEVVELEELAHELGRRVIVCHVLRYTSFYRKLRELIQSGILGEVINFNASEGIGPWHFAHSYVRGHWSVVENATPTIAAKCSHDMDLLHWLLDKKCKRVSSFGHLTFFKKENYKLNDQYPMFDATRYLDQDQKIWLAQVYDNPDGEKEEILGWLKSSDWGRNVFQCDNTAPDHQTVNLEFEGGTTGTFTMSAFDEGRNYEFNGTKARLRAGDFYKEHLGADIIITDHASNRTTRLNVVDGNPHPKFGDYHNGGDVGFIKELHLLLTQEETPPTSITSSLQSHLMAFGSEESRKTGEVISIDQYYRSLKSRENALD